jgi:hypothetical protein
MIKKIKEKSLPAVFYILVFILPAIVMLPYASHTRELVRLDEYVFIKQAAEREAVFNLTVGIMFVTSMLWILIVIPLVAIRDSLIKKHKLRFEIDPEIEKDKES